MSALTTHWDAPRKKTLPLSIPKIISLVREDCGRVRRIDKQLTVLAEQHRDHKEIYTNAIASAKETSRLLKEARQATTPEERDRLLDEAERSNEKTLQDLQAGESDTSAIAAACDNFASLYMKGRAKLVNSHRALKQRLASVKESVNTLRAAMEPKRGIQ